MMIKESRYNPFISIDTSVARIMNDPFLTPTQKRGTIGVLYGGASISPNSLQGVVSTRDLVRGAIGVGVGRVTARYLGTILGGVFGGLSHNTMNRVQNVGALAGMLKGTGLWE